MTSSARRSLLDPERLAETLGALVRVPSENPPGDEAAAAEVMASLSERVGLEVALHESEPGRPSVVARWRGGDGPTLTYCSHIDVVPAGDPSAWAHDPYAATILDGAMIGRGTSDAKGPCAAALEAVAILRAEGFAFDGTLELAFVCDEESGGFKGAGPLVSEGKIGGAAAIVGEPTSLRVVRAQRGIAWLRITTYGKAGHGSAPERGVSAIRHMAEVIARLDESLPDIDHPLLGGPTIGVGTITGGVALNVIPARCTIEVDRRMVPGEDETSTLATIHTAIDAARERFPELRATVEIVGLGAPFEIAADSPLVTAATAAVQEATGAPATIMGFRGASDARFFAEAGADVIVLGPGDISGAHTAHESIELTELADGALVYASLFARMLA